jgi:hypothetical protein
MSGMSGMSEYSRGGAETRRDSEAEDFFSACSAPPREPVFEVSGGRCRGGRNTHAEARRRGEIQKQKISFSPRAPRLRVSLH